MTFLFLNTPIKIKGLGLSLSQFCTFVLLLGITLSHSEPTNCRTGRLTMMF
jgi:hypothetical protein